MTIEPTPTEDPKTEIVPTDRPLATAVGEAPAPEEVKPAEPPPMMIAQTPDQMIKAQAQLVEAMIQKLSAEKGLLEERKTNLEAAKKAKIATQGWKREVKLSEKRVRYYGLVLAALKEGYCIVPEFPVGIIAVRTDKAGPRYQSVQRWYGGIKDVPPAELEQGKGRYVGPEPDLLSEDKPVTLTKADGERITEDKEFLTTCGFREVDMPLRLVKPQIINELDRAMALKLFDEIGVLPGNAANKRTKVDPMIIGRIHLKDGAKSRTCNFLVTWWLDPETI